MTSEEKQKREIREYKHRGFYSQANGRSYTYIICPFCQAEVKAFIWSLSGGGKKCPCGALHCSAGITFAPKPKEKKINTKFKD